MANRLPRRISTERIITGDAGKDERNFARRRGNFCRGKGRQGGTEPRQPRITRMSRIFGKGILATEHTEITERILEKPIPSQTFLPCRCFLAFSRWPLCALWLKHAI